MRFTEVLKLHGVEYRSSGHEHCRPGWVQLDCPKCGMKGRFRLGFNLAYKYLNCWACGSMPLVATMMDVLGLQYHEVKVVIKDLEAEGEIEKVVHRGKYKPPSHTLFPLEESDGHCEYLRKRKFDPGTLVRLWGVQALRLAGPLSWRIWIPIYLHDDLVSWTSRSISDNHHQRYRSAPSGSEKIPHKSILYGEHYVRHAVVVCEGPFDVWRVGPGAVATFGTGFKREQVVRLAKFPIRVVCYDNEPDGQKAATKLVEELSVFPGKTYNVVLDAKDPGAASPREIRQLRKAFLD